MRSSPSSRKHVHVIAAGLRPLPSAAAMQSWLEGLHELDIVATTSSSVVGSAQAGDLTIGVLNELLQEIATRYDRGEGVVVVHSLDAVLLSSAAATYSLTGLTKPVVFTVGGPPSVVVPGLSAVSQQANLVNAVQAATLKIPEVCLVFGNRLLRASAAVRTASPGGAVSFDADERGVFGRIDFSIRLNDRNIRPIPRGGTLRLVALAQRVAYVRLTPWLHADELRQQLASAQALLLDARPATVLPHWLLTLLQEQPLTGVVAVLMGEPAAAVNRREVVVIANARPDAVLAKLAWAAAARTPREAAALVRRPLPDEGRL